MKKFVYRASRLVKENFLPFIAFLIGVPLIRSFPFGALLYLAFINAEWAVKFWVEAGYSYWIAFPICALCGNIDLLMWFLLFGRLSRLFDIKRYEISEHDGRVRHFIKTIVFGLRDIAQRHPHLGLFLMGCTPFCGIVVGVPTAILCEVRYGYFVMAAGNTVKIIAFGFVISHTWLYLSCLGVLILIIFRHKLKPLLRW